MNNPQDLYHSVAAGGDPKAFLLTLHKHNTGALRLNEIRQEEERKKREQRKFSLENQKTVLMPIIKAEREHPYFYLDEHRRMTLKMLDSEANTVDLVEEAVELFRRHTGAYPIDIVLSPFRFAHTKHYYHQSGIRIPYRYEPDSEINFDVLCRGLGGVNWIL